MFLDRFVPIGHFRRSGRIARTRTAGYFFARVAHHGAEGQCKRDPGGTQLSSSLAYSQRNMFRSLAARVVMSGTQRLGFSISDNDTFGSLHGNRMLQET